MYTLQDECLASPNTDVVEVDFNGTIVETDNDFLAPHR